MHRRKFLNISAALMSSGLLGPALASGQVFAGDSLGKYSVRARKMVRENTIIDMLAPV